MEAEMPIGRFSQVCRLSIKTLRHYDEMGLLKPARVDRWTGYRYYTLAQAPIAEQIRLLRAVEMPLDEIRLFLAETDSAIIERVLAAHQERLQGRIREYQHALATFKLWLQRKETVMEYDIQIKDQPEQPVVSIRQPVMMEDIGQAIPQLLGELHTYLEDNQPTIVGAPTVLYHSMVDDQLDMEVALPVAEKAPETARVKNSVIPANKVAWLTHTGPYDGITSAFHTLATWASEQGYTQTGPNYEVYVTDPATTPNPADYRTDIHWPIA